jgi:RNA polymerase sigma factor (sigma-70 family)
MKRVLSHILGKMSLPVNENSATDAELLLRFTEKQDQIAFELLLWRHGTWVLRVCQSILHHTQDAEDAFQAIFLILAQKAKTIRQGKSLSSWLMKTTYRVCYRLRIRLAKHRAHEFTEFASPELDARTTVGDEQQIIRSEIHQLPAAYREAITLFYFCHFTTRQMAEQLKCPRGTVLSRLAQAKHLLKRKLTRRGVTLGSISTVLLTTSMVVSRELIQSTLSAAVRLTTSKHLACLSGFVTLQTLYLLEETMRISVFAKIKGMLALAAILLVGATIGLLAYQGPAKPAPIVPEPIRGNLPSPLIPAAEMEVAQPTKPSTEGTIQISMPTGSWERVVELTFPVPVTVSMNIQFKGKQMTTTLRAKVNQKALESFSKMDQSGFAELLAFKDMELAIKMESEFSLAADGLLYGVITGVEVDSESLQKVFTNPLLIKQFKDFGEIGQIAMFAPMLEMAGGVLMDQAFSMRFRVDTDTLSLKDIKIAGLDLASRFVGPLGAIYPAVTNGRFKKKSAGSSMPASVGTPVSSVRETTREISLDEKATQELQLATAWKNQGEVAKAYYQFELIKRRYPNTRQALEASKSSTQLLKEKGE